MHLEGDITYFVGCNNENFTKFAGAFGACKFGALAPEGAISIGRGL